MSVRVRFAPSPTGTLHIGSARTALFNWLFARKEGGVFVLRIEDTDRARSQPELLSGILEDLRWMGLDWDEGPFHQSERITRYQRYAQDLLSRDLAYYEKGDARGEAVKFRVPRETLKIRDTIHGTVVFDNELLEDFVIQKSDGSPSYNFACVVDDHEMQITDVVRGDDHLSNTPKQVALYRALGWQEPRFAHMPLILAPDARGGRLSKRKGAEGISRYREEGFLPDGFVNAMALLGFSPGTNREVVSRKELIEAFSLKRVNKKSARFDFDKMVWINAQHLKRLPLSQLVEQATPIIERTYGPEAVKDHEYIQKVVALFKGRIKVLSEFSHFTDFCFTDSPVMTREAAQILEAPYVGKLFEAIIEALEDLKDFTVENIEHALRKIATEQGLTGKQLVHPTRAAITGKTVSPGLFETIYLLGYERTVLRLKRRVEHV